jgi:prepilin-type N-terminal cleavage/methylation domain-containing protein
VREGQRGFTVLEILLALAIALPVAITLAGVVRLASGGAEATAGFAAQAAAMNDFVERLDAESHGAAALFVPATDVLGNPSCDPDGECRELDFFTRDTQGNAHFWAYRFDPLAHAIQRYAYATLGASGPQGVQPSGDALPMRKFEVRRVPISKVRVPGLASYPPKDVSVALGYPGVTGGNALAIVNLSNDAFHLRRELVPHLAASGFTVIVGTYAPSPPPTPQPTTVPSVAPSTAPSTSPSSSPGEQGIARTFISFTMWQKGPCINEPPDTPGCQPGGQGQQQDQQGSDYGPGGTFSAPPGSQIPLSDVCQSPDAPQNPNAVMPIGEYDAAGNFYVSVSDALNGVTEAWYVTTVGNLGQYVVPVQPLTPAKYGQSNAFALQVRNGPGYSYLTSFWVGC